MVQRWQSEHLRNIEVVVLCRHSVDIYTEIRTTFGRRIRDCYILAMIRWRPYVWGTTGCISVLRDGYIYCIRLIHWEVNGYDVCVTLEWC